MKRGARSSPNRVHAFPRTAAGLVDKARRKAPTIPGGRPVPSAKEAQGQKAEGGRHKGWPPAGRREASARRPARKS